MGPLGPLVLAVARDLHQRGRGLDDGRKFVHVLPPCSQSFKEWLLRSSSTNRRWPSQPPGSAGDNASVSSG